MKRRGDEGRTPTWRPAALSEREYMECAGEADYVRALSASPPGGGVNRNLLGFTNRGGLFGKGVCWWHSRFTRAALYLAYFLPDQPRPSPARVREIVRALMSARSVVAVPGYGSLREFSLDHEKLIQGTFERRQIFEGVLCFAWVNGLAGSSRVDPCRMKALMERVRAGSERGLVYAKLQTPGLDAHAVLVTMTENLARGGCRVRYLDSNARGESSLMYHAGYGSLTLSSGMTGVPYPQRSGELERIRTLVRRFIARGGRTGP